MGVIDGRRFNVATGFGDSGDLEVVNVWLADEGTWDIDLAEVVKVNGLAVAAHRKLTYRVMQHELRLLLSFLVDEPGSPLTLRHADSRLCSGHVKRFISESFGLEMLTAAAERHHRWKLNDSERAAEENALFMLLGMDTSMTLVITRVIPADAPPRGR